MNPNVERRQEHGVALITTLLLVTLMSALLAGFSIAVLSDARFRGVDKNRATAFYAAHAGLEKLTADLGALFTTNFAPSGALINLLEDEDNEPDLDEFGIRFLTTTDDPGYQVNFTADSNGNPLSEAKTIQDGPYAGLIGQVTPYSIDVTARTKSGTDVHLNRTLQTVTIPVFQFGTFSNMDLGFHSGAVFNFGGRVHANGNLYLAGASVLTLSEKITTAGEVIRFNLMNGFGNAGVYDAAVNVLKTPGNYRDLQENEGSLKLGIGSLVNEPNWTGLSIGTYNGNIRSSRTGGKRLDLALTTMGGTAVDLIRRPATANENSTNPALFMSRYFSMASLRILISDTAGDITSLPTVTGAPPLSLDTVVGGAYAVGANNPPLAAGIAPASDQLSIAVAAGAATIRVDDVSGFNQGVGPNFPNYLFLNGTWVYCTGTLTDAGGGGPRFTGCIGTPAAVNNALIDNAYRSAANTGLNGGVIKIEKQDQGGAWTDVTLEILNLGFAGKNLWVAGCADPNPNAIIRFQRLRDRPSGVVAVPVNNCGNGSVRATDYWPNVLYDAREGNFRDSVATTVATLNLGGVMHYVELDVNNLRRWWQGAIGVSGQNSMDETGYVIYFSDRRGNRNLLNQESGEYGFEDFVNPASAAGTPNTALDTGEDVNDSGALDTYGQSPILPGGPAARLVGAARPWTAVNQEFARVNKAVFFRRALKLINGRQGNIIPPGLTVVSENPVYVQGDYNANGSFSGTHVATAIIADAVTLLSNAWNDRTTFTSPNQPDNRDATTSWYRVAIIAGVGKAFPRPTGYVAGGNFGTDGGVHNFLRYLEDWTTRTVNYRGSMAIFFHNRQAVGVFKQAVNDTVYRQPAARAYNFDADFLLPSLLPPRTPVFRDINTLGFTQITAIGK